MRSLVLIVSLLLAACGPSAAAKRAQTMLDRGDYQGASEYAGGELARSPGDAQLQRIRLRALLGMGDAKTAVAEYGAWRARRGEDDLAALRTMAMTTIWQGLTSPSAQLKLQAIRAIERLELEPLAEDVGRAMGDDSDVVAAAAAVAVLRAFPQAPEVADQMLRSEDPAARAIAVEGIGRKVRGYAADALRPLLADPDARVRAAAATAVGMVKDEADTERLAKLAADPSAEVRAAALRALAQGDRARAARQAVIGRALADESLAVRLAAVALAARIGKDAVRPMLEHADPMVAASAAKQVGDRAAAVAVFDRALLAEDPTVRAGVVNLLGGALDKGAAIARAEKARGDADVRVRIAAARALAYLDRNAPAIETFAQVAADAQIDAGERAGAAAELVRLGDPRGAPILEQLAASEDPSVRRAVVLAHLGAGTITPGLWVGLADDQAATRLDAAAALLTLGAR